MALVACPECQREISTAAAACPHCGHKLPRRYGNGPALLLLLVLAGAALYAGIHYIDADIARH